MAYINHFDRKKWQTFFDDLISLKVTYRNYGRKSIQINGYCIWSIFKAFWNKEKWYSKPLNRRRCFHLDIVLKMTNSKHGRKLIRVILISMKSYQIKFHEYDCDGIIIVTYFCQTISSKLKQPYNHVVLNQNRSLE